MAIQLKTWNLLVPKYCKREYYSRSDAKSLDKKFRLGLIFRDLKNDIENNGINIFCFQEVSREWGSILVPWFIRRGFLVDRHHYGNDSSDGMGVMIVWKNDITLHKSYTYRIGFRLNRKLRAPSQSLFNQIYYGARYYMGYVDNIIADDISNAIGRTNIFMVMKFEKDRKEFAIANYHMPCAYSRPNVMKWHIKEILDILKGFKCPLIFGGDFNSTPLSEVYRIITAKMKSACSEGLDKEPITNYTFTSRNGEFEGCLDYIFYNNSDKLELISVADVEDVEEYLPNMDNPSDHLSLAANFRLL